MRFLDIRGNEVAKVGITWAMVALISIGYAIGWSAVHSMLVKRMGVEYLPYTYIGISLLGMVGSTVYLSLADAIRRDRLLILFCVATGATLMVARLLVTARPEGEAGVTLPLLIFFAAVFFAQGVGNAVLGTQIWTIINDLFRPSQGRRIYPILGTAGTIGGIAGGASIHALANLLGTANLVVVWALCIFALIPLTWVLRARFGAELRGQRPGEAHAEVGNKRLSEGWKFFRSSKMAMTLGFVAVMFWVVGSVADFQYTRIMNETFPSEDKLAGYYGIYMMAINISGLLVQLFFSSYLIRHIGVARGLLALPATVLAGFALISVWFSFWPGLIMRYSWDMIGMTIQGNSYQLALNAIPADLRARVRGFIEGVLNPLGGVLGGVVIIVLHHAFDSTAGRGWSDPITLAGTLLATMWIVVVWSSHRHYLQLVAENLKSADKRTAMDAIDCLEEHGNERAIELLKEVSTSPDTEKRVAALRVWGNLGGASAFAALTSACADPEVQVRLEALRAMSHASARHPLPAEARSALEYLLESDPDAAVRAAAFQALLPIRLPEQASEFALRWLAHPMPEIRTYIVEAVGKSDLNVRALLIPHLEDQDFAVRAAAVQALWRYEDVRSSARSVLSGMLVATQASPSPSHAAVLIACHRVGECPPFTVLEPLLASPDPIARVLAGALILQEFTDPEVRKHALDTVFMVLADPDLAERLRRELLPHIPDFHENAADAIINAVNSLPADQRARVSTVLADWYGVLQVRLQTEQN
ncbi:MFS transporter [Propionivibrio sp.]|uniref:MFS transporter n=1 Tax=Propionivibrio sp. TaxID=2212460 RepID=UPI003BEFA3B7